LLGRIRSKTPKWHICSMVVEHLIAVLRMKALFCVNRDVEEAKTIGKGYTFEIACIIAGHTGRSRRFMDSHV